MKELVDASSLKPEIVEGVDIMVVRELTGDVYFGTPKVMRGGMYEVLLLVNRELTIMLLVLVAICSAFGIFFFFCTSDI